MPTRFTLRFLRLVHLLVAGLLLAACAQHPFVGHGVNMPLASNLPLASIDYSTVACMAKQLCMRDYFFRITLGNDYERGQHEPREPFVTKAVRPIRLAVIVADDTPKALVTRTDDTLESTIAIARAAGVNLHFWERDPVVPANLFIFISDDFERDRKTTFADHLSVLDHGMEIYEKLRVTIERPDEDCAFISLSSNTSARSVPGKQQIGSLEIGVALVPSGLRRHAFYGCLVEETLQMLGLSYDFRGTVRSTFKDSWNGPSSPTVFDFMLLRLLYHPLIEPGMTQSEIAAVFPEAYNSIANSQPTCRYVQDCMENGS